MGERRHLVLAVVTDICDQEVTYPSCKHCCSKLFVDDQTSSQRFHCLKCGRVCSRTSLQHRYRLVLGIADGQVTGRVVVFGHTLDGFFGKTATDFHRSLSELGKSGYPAEAMLSDSLGKTFLGKYFYFGVKTETSDPPSLKDVVTTQTNTDSDTSTYHPGKDTSHTLVYQMIQCNEGVYATVTDHMRFSVSALRKVRKGEVGLSTEIRSNNQTEAEESRNFSSKHDSAITDISSECSSLSKTSSLYAKQISVMFSFENSASLCDAARVSKIEPDSGSILDTLQESHGNDYGKMSTTDLGSGSHTKHCKKSSSFCADNDADLKNELARNIEIENSNLDWEGFCVDMCQSELDQYPVTQKLNFTDLNDTETAETAETRPIVVTVPDCGNIPFLVNLSEAEKFRSHESNGHNDSCHDNIERVNEIESVALGNDNSVPNIYLPDSEGLSAFLDTFEDESDITSTEREEKDVAKKSVPDTCTMERSQNIDNIQTISENVSGCVGLKVVNHNTDSSNKLDSVDLEAFLNSFDVENSRQNSCLDMKNVNTEPEIHRSTTLSEENRNTKSEIYNQENSRDKSRINKSIGNDANINTNVTEKSDHGNLKTNCSELRQRLGIKGETQSLEFNVVDDSGFSQSFEACASFQEYLSKSSAPREELNSDCKGTINEPDLIEGNQQMNRRDQTKVKNHIVEEKHVLSTIQIDTYSENGHKVNGSIKSNKNDLDDLEIFLSEISLAKDITREREVIKIESAHSRPCHTSDITASTHTSEARICMKRDVNELGKNQEIVSLKEQSTKHRDALRCNIYKTNENSCESKNTSSTSKDVFELRTDDISNIQESNTSETVCDESQNVQFDASGDLFDDSDDWCMNCNASYGMIDNTSEGIEKFNTSSFETQAECLENDIVIAESQGVNQQRTTHDSYTDSVNEHIESSPSDRHVQFDKRLQQVISCDLMDVRMRLRESPVGKRKIKSVLKPCLKTRGIYDEEKENHVVKFAEVLSKCEEGIIEKFETDCNITFASGSQDLFGPSPVAENNISVLNDGRQRSSPYAEIEVDTPDIFISREYVLKECYKNQDESAMTPDLFSQVFSFENSNITPEVCCDEFKRTNNLHSSSNKKRKSSDSALWKEVVSRRAKTVFKLLVENTPEVENCSSSPPLECSLLGEISVMKLKERVNPAVGQKGSGGSRGCRQALSEVTANYQDSPDLFDSPADSSNCDALEQGFIDLPDHGNDLVKKLFF